MRPESTLLRMSDGRDGLIAARAMPNGRVAHIYPLILGRARLGVGPATSMVYDDEW